MIELLLTALAFAVVGPALGFIVFVAILIVAACASAFDDLAATVIVIIGLVSGLSIAAIGLVRAVAYFAKAVGG